MFKKGPKGHYLSAEHFWPGMEERKNFNCLLTNKNQTVKKILKNIVGLAQQGKECHLTV